MNTPYINLEAEQYFKDLAANKPAIEAAFAHIGNTLNHALKAQDYNTLLALIPYIESGEGHLAFEHIGETRRILRILNIVALEHKYMNYTFASDCSCIDELMDKYFLTLFAFRRLLFQLSEVSVSEAIQYLQSNIISHFAAYVIATEELIIPTTTFYENLLDIYETYWSESSIQQFLLLIQKQS